MKYLPILRTFFFLFLGMYGFVYHFNMEIRWIKNGEY